MRRALFSLALALSLVAKAAIAQDATGPDAPLPPIPPPPPPPPPAPPAPPPPHEIVYGQPPPPPPGGEVVYVEEPKKQHHEHHAHREEPADTHQGFSFGIELNSFAQDFGFGGRITSPNLAHFIRLSAGGGVAWFPNALPIGPNPQDTWDAYYYGRLTIELTGPQLGPVRTYAFAGAILLGVPKELSSTEIDIGGIGGFGFEFLISRLSSYYVELGALGTGAQADQLVDSPIFANGFLISVGSRFYP
jgi:hypothetical protein